MNRRDFTRNVANVLRTNNIKKPMHVPKQVFHISDDNGNSKDFSVKATDKSAIFTIDDVDAIIDACIYVIQESLKRGEPVTFSGFGSLGLKYRKPRIAGKVNTDEKIFIEGRYIPKFSFGNDLRRCAKLYELSLQDRFTDEDEDGLDAALNGVDEEASNGD